MKKSIIFLLTLTVILISSCKKEEEPNEINGIITFDFTISEGDFYIYMDDDGDPSNGYTVYGTGTLTGSEGGVNYSFDTENIPAGSYYIYAGFDMESVDNMDPVNMQVWEGLGWYGNDDDAIMPVTAPITKLRGTYSFSVFELRK